MALPKRESAIDPFVLAMLEGAENEGMTLTQIYETFLVQEQIKTKPTKRGIEKRLSLMADKGTVARQYRWKEVNLGAQPIKNRTSASPASVARRAQSDTYEHKFPTRLYVYWLPRFAPREPELPEFITAEDA